jgi:hypothetical protein
MSNRHHTIGTDMAIQLQTKFCCLSSGLSCLSHPDKQYKLSSRMSYDLNHHCMVLFDLEISQSFYSLLLKGLSAYQTISSIPQTDCASASQLRDWPCCEHVRPIIYASAEVAGSAVRAQYAHCWSPCWALPPWILYWAEISPAKALHRLETLLAARHWRAIHWRNHLLDGTIITSRAIYRCTHMSTRWTRKSLNSNPLPWSK